MSQTSSITVFLSGSRSIQKLHPLVQQRIWNIMDKNFGVVIGDADGADTAFQDFLWDNRYPHVVVCCPGTKCRNNLGDWPQNHIQVPDHIRGREFYTLRDKAMAASANYGFVVWDGLSKGSLANIKEMKRLGKKSLVFYSQNHSFQVFSSGTSAS